MTSAGTQLQSSGLSSGLIKGLSSVNFVESVDTLCDEHAEPLDGSSMMSQSDARYPVVYFTARLQKILEVMIRSLEPTNLFKICRAP